jgi:hypothetical protein
MLGARGIELSANGRPALVSESPCRSFIAAAASPFDLRENAREEMREREHERGYWVHKLPQLGRLRCPSGVVVVVPPVSPNQATPPPFQRGEEKREAWKGERTKRFGGEGNDGMRATTRAKSGCRPPAYFGGAAQPVF